MHRDRVTLVPLVYVIIPALTLLVGCTPTGTMRVDTAHETDSAAVVKGPAQAAADPQTMSPQDAARLDQLWQKRTATSADNEDYPIGPGDVLTISVPDVEEIQQRKVRVSTQGNIELPLIGTVQVGGLTEEALARDLDDKLSKFMFNPQASVFVEEYKNREVAVVGSVNRPGMVLLSAPSETILEVITQAGGLSPSAADELILIPVSEGGLQAARRVSLLQPVGNNESLGTQVASADKAGSIADAGLVGSEPKPPADPASGVLASLGNAHPVTIPLKSTTLTGGGRYLNLPLRPGDVLVVPGGGEAMVVGWVHSPGHFGVGSGLTVLGAIGEAGGPDYAANTQEVTLIRSERNGTKEIIAVNLDKISRGEEEDIPVKANDVIDVPYSGARIGPYIFYSILTRVGIGGPAIPY